MSTQVTHELEARNPDGFPFHIGTRLVNHRDPDGKIIGHEYVPLTQADYLHPQEEDHFLSSNRHAVALRTLANALTLTTRDRPGRRVFVEHRIDWQRLGIEPHGPDAVVFDGFTAPYDDLSGTLPVEDFGAEILALFEVTSTSTRHIDLGDKFDEFLELGIPYYIVIDTAAPNGVPIVIGFRYVRGMYREMRRDPELGVLVPPLKLWFRWQRDRLIVADEDGINIPDFDEMTSRADMEKVRADAENARAELERARADTEKARADALAREIEKLKANMNGQSS